jgi:hypothetical protein
VPDEEKPRRRRRQKKCRIRIGRGQSARRSERAQLQVEGLPEIDAPRRVDVEGRRLLRRAGIAAQINDFSSEVIHRLERAIEPEGHVAGRRGSERTFEIEAGEFLRGEGQNEFLKVQNGLPGQKGVAFLDRRANRQSLLREVMVGLREDRVGDISMTDQLKANR